MPTGRVESAEIAWRTSLQEFGEQLRHRRQHVLRLSQAQMAARAGLDQSRISRIEAGGKPRDKATTVALAEAYRLSTTETRAWLALLFGDALTTASDTIAASSWGDWINSIYTLLENIVGNPSAHGYFAPVSSESLILLGPEALVTIDRLLAEQRPLPRAHLLVELAIALMHWLNQAGHHQRRLVLALAAADAAAILERRTVEGWLRADAIPWTLIEHFHDPNAARPHLERGLALASELKNHDMAALALAFLARVCLFSGDNRHAWANLMRARHLNPAPAIQARVDWIDGDLALRQKRYDRAYTLYRAAEMVDVSETGGFHTVVTPLLRLGELHLRVRDTAAAKQAFLALLTNMHPPLVGQRLAWAKHNLARVALIEGDVEEARRLSDEAGAALATGDDNAQLRRIISLFADSLSNSTKKELGASD